MCKLCDVHNVILTWIACGMIPRCFLWDSTWVSGPEFHMDSMWISCGTQLAVHRALFYRRSMKMMILQQCSLLCECISKMLCFIKFSFSNIRSIGIMTYLAWVEQHVKNKESSPRKIRILCLCWSIFAMRVFGVCSLYSL